MYVKRCFGGNSLKLKSLLTVILIKEEIPYQVYQPIFIT